jgi:hypothetical protein
VAGVLADGEQGGNDCDEPKAAGLVRGAHLAARGHERREAGAGACEDAASEPDGGEQQHGLKRSVLPKKDLIHKNKIVK